MIKNRLKEIRMGTYFMNQKEFATMLGIDPKAYSRYESSINPSSETMLRIAKKLDCKVEDIFQLIEENN